MPPAKNYPLIALTLLLLANTHFIALILAIPLAVVCIVLLLKEETIKQHAILTYSILIIGLCIGIVQVLPQDDSIFSNLPKPGYFSIERFRAFTTPFKAFYQFPDWRATHTWNTNVFTANKFIGIILALIFPLVLIKAFANKPLSLFVVLFASVAIAAFFYTELMYNYTVRHWGYIFLAYYAAVWLQYGIDQTNYHRYIPRFLPSYFTIENKVISQGLFYSTLITQVAAAGYAYTLDLNRNFCNAKEAALYIQQHHYKNELIILNGFNSGPSVSAYLDRPLYYPEYKGLGSYGKWNIKTWQVSKEELLKQIHELNNHRQAYLLMDDKTFNPNKNNQAGQIVFNDKECSIEYITSFDDGLINHEKFEFYKIVYKK